jgi:uncharacterized HAD superfamily protein
MKSSICIFDIDGTLANCDHRLHYVKNKPKNWDAFYSECMSDHIVWPVAEMLELFRKNHLIYIVTGRPERNRELTELWLNNNKIYFDKLIMRGDRDFRKSPDYKSSVCDTIEAEGNKIFLAVEDREDCINMFISRDIYTFNVSNGAEHDA